MRQEVVIEDHVRADKRRVTAAVRTKAGDRGDWKKGLHVSVWGDSRRGCGCDSGALSACVGHLPVSCSWSSVTLFVVCPACWWCFWIPALVVVDSILPHWQTGRHTRPDME